MSLGKVYLLMIAPALRVNYMFCRWELQQGKEKKVLAAVEMGAPVYSTPVVANGVLYVATQTHLYAIQQKP